MKKFNEGPELSSGDIDELVDSFNETSDKKVEEGEEGLDSFHELTKDEGLTGIGEGEESEKEREINKEVDKLEEDARVKAEKMLEKAEASPSSKENVGEVDTEKENVGEVDTELNEKNKGEEIEDEGIELDVEDIEYLDEEGKVESKNIESPISPLGERVESFENDTFVAESNLGSMYDKEDRENFEQIEDTVAINPKENLVALGDGMGGVGSGEIAAKDFKNMFENVRFGDLEGLSDEEIKADIFTKLQGMSENISEGMITCTMLKFFKDKEGNQKAVAVNIGDGCLYKKNKEGKVSEVVEAASIWKKVTEMTGSIVDDPDNWANTLNGMMRNFQYKYADFPAYLEKMSQDPDMQTLRDKFDFHKVMQYVENDKDLDEASQKKIFKLFKNLNRQILTSFNIPEEKRKDVEPWGKESIKIIDVQEKDKFFMASDGVADNLDEQEIASLMDEDFSSEQGRKALKQKINANIKNKAYYKLDDYSYATVQAKA